MEFGLDSSTLASRMQSFSRSDYARRPTPRVTPRGISDIFVKPVAIKPRLSSTKPITAIKKAHPKPVVPPTLRTPQPSTVLSRKYAKKPGLKHRRKRPQASSVLTALAVVLFLAGATVAGIGLRTNHKVIAEVQKATQSATTHKEDGAPEEAKPSAGAYGGYVVAPDLPRYVRIPKIGVDAMVKKQSVDKNGALQAPGNVHVAGWYDGSSKPGDGGAVLLDGHVAGPTTHGVFYSAKSLVAGDKIEVERGDGKVFTYKVVKSESKKAADVDMAAALLPVVTGKGGLNLITCTGKVTGWHYDERLVVYAVQI